MGALDGKIAVVTRNTRWCSDGLEIGCDNGEKVRVAFALDCCDREAMGYVATTGGITAEDDWKIAGSQQRGDPGGQPMSELDDLFAVQHAGSRIAIAAASARFDAARAPRVQPLDEIFVQQRVGQCFDSRGA